MNEEHDYFRRCERRERRMANLAVCDSARRAHERVAEIYAERRSGETPLPLPAMIIINDPGCKNTTPRRNMNET